MNIKLTSKNGTTLKTASKYCTEDINITFDPSLLDITTEEKTFTPTSTVQTYTPTSGTYVSKVTVNAVPTETKSVTPTTSSQTITPTSGKFLSSVSVDAIQTETKTATPSTSTQTITPTSGKFLSKVTVNAISTETKTVTPSASSQSVTPTSGKYLSKVTVNPIPSNYIIPSGTKTITENGTSIDVSTYQYVDVSVASSSGGEDPGAPDTPSGGTQTCTIILSGPSTYSFEFYCMKTFSAGEEVMDMKWFVKDSFIEISNVVCGSLITVVVSGMYATPAMRVSFYEPLSLSMSPGSVVGQYRQTFVLQAPLTDFGVPSLFELYDND